MSGIIKRDSQPMAQKSAGPEIPGDNFSPAYVDFLQRQCGGTMDGNGIMRAKSGARFCSCNMCGRVGTVDMQGRIFCDFHFPYRGNTEEEDRCTQALHKLRPLILIEQIASRYPVDDKAYRHRIIQRFNETCVQLGVEQMPEESTMLAHIRALINKHVTGSESGISCDAREQMKNRKATDNRDKLASAMRRLSMKLSMRSPDVQVRSRCAPHPADADEYNF